MKFIASLAAAVMLCAGAPVALGQDSVATTPGGNDALSAYDASSQRVRYIVDAVPLLTSWGNPIIVAPLVKASRDVHPMFSTQVLGSSAVSPNFGPASAFANKDFGLWSTAGAGVHASANSAPGMLGVSGFDRQFGIALSDFSLEPSNVVTAIVGRQSSNLNRLFVERIVTASSRAAAAGADTATLSLGAVDELGNTALRADDFGTLSATPNRVLGDNIVRINAQARGGAANTLTSSAGVNTGADAGATTYVVSNDANPTNTPAIVQQGGTGAFAMVFDFLNRFRTGSSTAGLSTTTSHLPVGIVGQRGNPSFAPITTLGGNAGVVAGLGAGAGEAAPTRLFAFGINFGAGGSAPTLVAGSQRGSALPSPITSPYGFTANNASFRQYLSQTAFRGGNGQVGIGTAPNGQLVLAATARDMTAGNFIAAAAFSSGGTGLWQIVAHPGQPVLSSVAGAAVGVIAPGANFSSPAVDLAGNVYFIADYQPDLAPAAVGLFKAARSSAGYRLELLLATGQTIVGANSATEYTVSSLSLTDGDSIASGTVFSNAIIQERDPGASNNRAISIRRFGGMVVNAVITYDRAGVDEAYDAVLFVGPGAGTDCVADVNGQNGVTIDDLFLYLNAYFVAGPVADTDGNGAVSIDDLFLFINAWFLGCP